jgi:sodium-dependent dicarboxylate transporter 2/3/5
LVAVVRRAHQTADALETYSPAEEQFNRRRRTVGLIAGPGLCIVVLFLPLGIPPAAHRLAAVMALMIVLWMTEALPLAVTALAGPMLAVLLGVAPASAVFAPFADPIIFLFIGSFILAEAMFVHRLDRRLAYTALASPWIGRSGFRLIAVYAAVTCVISMWMSNTATTAMLFPLGLAVLAEIGRGRKRDAAFARYALALMLVTSFAASIGGIATPVGTPPNLLGKGFLQQAGVSVSFAGWMLLGVPVMILLMAFVGAWMLWPAARGISLGDSARQAVSDELAKLGRVSIGERNVMIAFALTAALWIIPGFGTAVFGSTTPFVQRMNALLPESIAALVGAVLLFLMPIDWRTRRFTMTWEEASGIDWGIILLFGGGLAMGRLADSTGLSVAIGQFVTSQFPGIGTTGLTLVFTGVAVVMSEAASNTAAANIIVPTAIAVSQAAGVSPLEPALGATLGASLGFMMPISTPPNAIVYSSGYIPIGAMMRHGIALDIAGYFIIVAAVLGFGWVLR